MQHEFCCVNLICRNWRTWKRNQIAPTYLNEDMGRGDPFSHRFLRRCNGCNVVVRILSSLTLDDAIDEDHGESLVFFEYWYTHIREDLIRQMGVHMLILNGKSSLIAVDDGCLSYLTCMWSLECLWFWVLSKLLKKMCMLTSVLPYSKFETSFMIVKNTLEHCFLSNHNGHLTGLAILYS